METTIQNDKISYYLKMLEVIRAEVHDDETARVILQEIGKDGRVAMMHPSKSFANSSQNGNGETPASHKQLWYLKFLGINVADVHSLTRKAASALIDKAVEEQKVASA